MRTDTDQESYAQRMLACHERAVYRLCFVYLHNVHDAQDAAQETFIKLVIKPPVFTDHAHERAWLLRVAANLCKNMLRRRRVIPTPLDGIPLDKPDASDFEFFELIGTLEPVSAAILHLHYHEGYATDEIAAMLRATGFEPMRLKTSDLAHFFVIVSRHSATMPPSSSLNCIQIGCLEVGEFSGPRSPAVQGGALKAWWCHGEGRQRGNGGIIGPENRMGSIPVTLSSARPMYA